MRVDLYYAYLRYLERFPRGRYSGQARTRIIALFAHKAIPAMHSPQTAQPGAGGDYDVTVTFTEGGGGIGYALAGYGSVIDVDGRHWGEYGSGNRGDIAVRPGGIARWALPVSRKFAGSTVVMHWSGEDAAGNILTFETNVALARHRSARRK